MNNIKIFLFERKVPCLMMIILSKLFLSFSVYYLNNFISDSVQPRILEDFAENSHFPFVPLCWNSDSKNSFVTCL